MKARDFRIGWRLLLKEPGYSAAVICGLTMGFAVCFLLLSFAHSSFRFDAQVPDNDRIYMLKRKVNTDDNPRWWEFMPISLRNAALQSGLDLKATVVWKSPVKVRTGGIVRNYLMRAVDPSFQEIFGTKPLQGDLQKALTRPDAIALTESTAGQLFGDSYSLGKTVQIGDKAYEVAAILADPPATTTVPYSILTGFNTAIISNDDRAKAIADWANGYVKIYVKLGATSSPQRLVQFLQDALDRSPANVQISPEKLKRLGNQKISDIALIDLPSVHFDPDFVYAANMTNDDRRYGDKRTLLALSAVALLILLLAATNYVNLATVRTMRRRREIAVRKLMGTSASRITGQFLAESMLVAVLATILGIVLGWALSPVFSELIIHQREPSTFSDIVDKRVIGSFTPLTVGFSLLFGTFVGLLAGIYPAWIALHVRVAEALAGRGSEDSTGHHGQSLRRLLTILQFATAMGLTSVTLAISWQTSYATKLDPGFDPTRLVTILLPFDAPTLKLQLQPLRNALIRLPEVEDVAGEVSVVGSGENGESGEVQRIGGGSVPVSSIGVTSQFFQTYRVDAIAGRVFDPSQDREENPTGVVINSTAAHAIGFESPQAAVGQILKIKNSGGTDSAVRILGVSPDILHRSLRQPPEPLIYVLHVDGIYYLTVRVRSDIDAAERAIESIWPKYFPNDVLTIRRSKTYIVQQYSDDVRLAKLLTGSALIAVLIAAFGIYVLSAYSVLRRAKEIGLRKLFGANRRAICLIVWREFAALIAIGAVIGLPIAALATQNYLADFNQRAPVEIFSLLVALLISVLVAVVSTLRHTFSAMRTSPASLFRE